MGLCQGGDFEYVSDEPIVRHFMIVAENGFRKELHVRGRYQCPSQCSV